MKKIELLVDEWNFSCLTKTFKIMRITLFLMLALILQTFANEAYSQKTRLSLDYTNTRLEVVLDDIEELSEFFFLANEKLVDLDRSVSLSVKNKKIDEILDMLFAGTDVVYTITDRKIILAPSFLSEGFQQQLTVSGTVTDESGEPLPGVTVIVQGTTQGTVTNADGEYTITNLPEDATLQFSFVGMRTQEVVVGNQTIINVEMAVDAIGIEEVVAVGYGIQKKVNVTGAVDVISSEQMENRQASTVSQILQGQSPGLEFSVGRAGFQPGASMSIDIRGIGSLNGGSPLVLIDGFPGDMDRLNPDDIESISVLKDAAASAIYGARAPYGVILITTKSGQKNKEITVSYSGNVSINTPDRLPEMLDSYTFARVVNEMGDNAGGRPYPEDAIKRIIAYQNKDFDYLKQFLPDNMTHYETTVRSDGRFSYGSASHANYDWYDVHFGSALNQRHNLSLQGGSDKTSYYISGGVVDQEGVMNYGTDTYQRFNLMGKVNLALTDWWDLRYESRFMKSPRERFNTRKSGDNGYLLIFRELARTVPTQAKYDGFGNYSFNSHIPIVEKSGTDRWETTENWHILGTEIKPAKGWNIIGDFTYRSIGVDCSKQNFTVYEPYADGRVLPMAATVPSKIEQIQENNFYWATNLYSSYDRSIAEKHNVSVMAGMQYEYNKAHMNSALKTNIIIKDVPSLETADGTATVSENLGHWATQGYFGRLTYNFNEKYLFEVNARYDGTSRFQKGSRWGVFPSFSAGWNVNKENFWHAIEQYINTFKLRGSWGQLGNQLVVPYQDIALMPLRSQPLNWIFNYGENRPMGYTSTPRLVSPNLTWETVTTKNIGLNLAFLDHRLQADIDLFERITDDMIGPSEPLPGVLGASVPSSNNSTLRSRGWEASVRWKHNLGTDFSYFFNLNVHDVKTVVTDYLNPSGLITDWYKGKVVGEIWGYTANELFKSQEELNAYLEKVDMSFIYNKWNPGDLKYLDTNGDGKVDRGNNSLENHGDLSIIGNSTPRYQFGISAGINFKNFDFSLLLNGTLKRDYFMPSGTNQYRFWGLDRWLFTALTPAHLDYFRDQPGDEYTGLYEGDANINLDSYWPKNYLDGGQNRKNRHPSTRYLVDASYIRLQNIQLGYNLPQKILSRAKLQKLRVFFSGENLFTGTKLLKGIDPVALRGYGGNIGNTYGVDKIFSFGINITM